MHAQAVHVEHAFISALLQNPHVLPDCEELLAGSTEFSDLMSQFAWEAAVDIGRSRDASVTVPAVRSVMIELGAAPDKAQTYLVDRQADQIATDGDARRLAERVRDGYVVRTVDAQAATIRQVCSDPRSGAVDALGALTQAVNTVSAASVTTSDILHRGDTSIQETYEIILRRAEGALPGLSTGSSDLDSMTGGLAAGQVIIVGGRPAVGKSVTLVDFARAALREGAGVIIFSMEMPHNEIMGRLIAAEGGINAARIRDGRLSDEDKRRFVAASTRVPWENLYIVDQPSVTMGQVTAITRQVHREFERRGVEDVLVGVDYLQIMGTDPGRTGRREQSRQQFLGEVCVGMKALAMELSIPVVALSQLNRGSGKERPPTMEDLRESGDIENNADVILLLHRPDATDAEDRPGEIDYIMAKHRQAPAPQIRTRTHEYVHFRTHDMTHSAPPEDYR